MPPQASVVIATLRRHRKLARALDHLAAQRGAGAFEVIVADDPARDDAGAVARAIGDRPFDVRQVHTSAPGVSAQRNAGWRAARAPLVLFLGDDIMASPRLVAEHLAWHAAEPAEEVGVLGRVDWARELRVSAFMRLLDHGIQFDFDAIQGREAGWGRFYAANASVKRRLLERVGGFDETFRFGYEELELARRLHDHGFRLLYNPAAHAEHLHRPTLREYRRRMRLVAGAERRMVERHPDVAPYFHRLFSGAVSDRAGGRGRWLAPVVPRRMPVLGPRVHASAEAAYRRQLGRAFLSAWEEGRSSPGGSPPGGPK